MQTWVPREFLHLSRHREVLQLCGLALCHFHNLGGEARKLRHMDAERLVACSIIHLPRTNSLFVTMG